MAERSVSKCDGAGKTGEEKEERFKEEKSIASASMCVSQVPVPLYVHLDNVLHVCDLGCDWSRALDSQDIGLVSARSGKAEWVPTVVERGQL